ncbi:CHAD domain-containing protein [Paragemmobacter straminiformis]|uniref:CHAD domain-containing protein n=1 Tax=Paragemmobacter straminiformis TaxID=2045119 RepID=A0A842ICQ1_9RHOB|nr:CHAD domain-containing protein [Gemmobacter straminiformis]MBC2836874.1 CHAD domain-containing protein [Gemmobacter straminiformis]
MDEQVDEPVAAVELAEIGPGMTAEAAFRHIAQRCGAEIDAHLAFVLDRDDPEGPHKARVWLRRLVTALDAFGPILKRRATAGLRDEAKAIFRELGKLRDRDVMMARLDAADVSPKLRDASARLREKVRMRLRERNAVLFSPVMLRAVDEGALFRTGPAALVLRAGPVDDIAVEALDLAWETCAKQKADLRRLPPEVLHGFRKRLKTLRYLSEFFAPFLIAQGA